jgi:cytochrome c-type biogenesis protein CcmH
MRSATVLVLALLVLGAALVPAQAVKESEVTAELMCPCPNCGGKQLSACYCGEAMKAKEEIHQMIEQGKTKEEIVASFVERYGEWILSKPEEKGFNLVGYWLPTVGLLVGAGAVGIFLRRAIRRGRASGRAAAETGPQDGEPGGGRTSGAPGAGSEGAEPAADDLYEERLRRELEELES